MPGAYGFESLRPHKAGPLGVPSFYNKMNMTAKTLLFAAALYAAAFSSCATHSTTGNGALRTGDLVFVGIPSDYSLGDGSMAGAIGEATGGGDSLNIIHVAILEVAGDSTWIIDATIKRNVDRHPLDTFIRDFTLKDGSLPTFIIKRLKDPAGAEKFVENAKSHLGEPYDAAFLPDNGALYCSELVRDSYVAEDGTHLFAQAPMNFKDADGQMPLYWQQLFDLLGMPVPQGVEGTNPRAMCGESILETVRTGF